jgi:hypothetical protein
VIARSEVRTLVEQIGLLSRQLQTANDATLPRAEVPAGATAA